VTGEQGARAEVILVVGDANADLGATLDRFPREGGDEPMRGLTWGSGGSAANVATGLALLGAQARLVARVGADPAAEVALAAARAAGVDLEAVQRDGALPTGLCFAAVSPGGERTFFSYRGANAALAPPDAEDVEDVWRDVAWLHVGGHALLEGRQREATLGLIAEARRRGALVSLDLCPPVLRAWPRTLRELGPRLAVLFANELEMEAIAASSDAASADAAPADAARAAPGRDPLETALAALSGWGVPLVAAKLGARGSLLVGPGAARRALPPCPVEACDTTCAGDAYVAGFLFALLRGASPEAAGRLGNAMGALATTRPGAAAALPTRADLFRFLTTHDAASAADDPARLLAPTEYFQ